MKQSGAVRQKATDKEPSTIESIHKEIRTRICLLQYPPGMRLGEEALASEFGVSRTPIRSVLQRLEFEGLVEFSRQKGAVVTTVDLIQLKEVYQLRIRLTGFIGEMMTSRVPEEAIESLTGMLERCQSMPEEYDPQALVDLGGLYNEFHELMTGMINNRPLRRISDLLYFQTSRVWLQLLPELDWQEEVEIVCHEMTDVLAGLRKTDMLAVGQVRHGHMVELLNRVSGYLGSALPPTALRS